MLSEQQRKQISALCQHTPTLTVFDARGLRVREVQYNRSSAHEAPDERVTQHQYDAAGRLHSSIDPRLGKQCLEKPKPQPNWVTRYSLSGRVLRTDSVDAGWRAQSFDAAGRPMQRFDGRSTQQRFEYDALSRPTAIYETVNNHEACVERFTYGDNGVVEEAEPRNLRGQLIRHDDLVGTREIGSYALTGQPLTETQRFLSGTESPDWLPDSAARDALLEKDLYTTVWRYDIQGKILTQTDAKGHTQRFVYNLSGQLRASFLILSGQPEQCLVSDVAYNAFGRPLSETVGNGVHITYNYDPATQCFTRNYVQRADQTVLQDLCYAYDPVGNVVRIEDQAQAIHYANAQKIDPACTYSYDALYQLIEAHGRENAHTGQQCMQLPQPIVPLVQDATQLTNYIRRYHYDEIGNLLATQHQGAQSYTLAMQVAPTSNCAVSQQPDQLIDVAAYFDANGNPLQLQSGQPLAWDARNQLQQVVLIHRENGVDDVERYDYNGSGQRLKKIRSWQASNQTHREEVRYLPGLELRSNTATSEHLQVLTLSASQCRVRVLHWEQGKPDEIENDTIRYSMDDHLGSSLLELDREGNKLTYEEYYPFGGTALWSVKSQVEAKYKCVRYSGKEHDATGLYYYGYRYYAPWLGRWLNPDPAGTIDGLNLFQMVGNNPITLIDPDGRTRQKTPRQAAIQANLKMKLNRRGTGKARQRNPPQRYDPHLVPAKIVTFRFRGRFLRGLDPGTQYMYRTTVDYQGSNREDFDLANLQVRLLDTPVGHVWHHFHNYRPNPNNIGGTGRGTLYLMRKEHHLRNHTGGAFMYRDIHRRGYR